MAPRTTSWKSSSSAERQRLHRASKAPPCSVENRLALLAPPSSHGSVKICRAPKTPWGYINLYHSPIIPSSSIDSIKLCIPQSSSTSIRRALLYSTELRNSCRAPQSGINLPRTIKTPLVQPSSGVSIELRSLRLDPPNCYWAQNPSASPFERRRIH